MSFLGSRLVRSFLVPLVATFAAAGMACSPAGSSPAAGGQGGDGKADGFCTPASCDLRCGSITDGCGGQLDCGACGDETGRIFLPQAENPIDRSAQVELRVGEVVLSGDPSGAGDYTKSYWLDIPCELTGSSTTPLEITCSGRGAPVAADGTFTIPHDGDLPAIIGSISYGPDITITGYGGLTSTGSLFLQAPGSPTPLAVCNATCSAPLPDWQADLPTDGRGLSLPVTAIAETDVEGTVNVAGSLMPCGDRVWKLVLTGVDVTLSVGGALSTDGSFNFQNHTQPTGSYGRTLQVRGHMLTGATLVIDDYEEWVEFEGGTTHRSGAGTVTFTPNEHIADSGCF